MNLVISFIHSLFVNAINNVNGSHNFNSYIRDGVNGESAILYAAFITTLAVGLYVTVKMYQGEHSQLSKMAIAYRLYYSYTRVEARTLGAVINGILAEYIQPVKGYARKSVPAKNYIPGVGFDW